MTEDLTKIKLNRSLAISVAMTRERLIGRGNQMPWRIPEELRLYRRRTTGGIIIMGRRTFKGIGRPLPGRRNLIVTSQNYSAAPVSGDTYLEFCPSLTQAVKRALLRSEPIYICGGSSIYRQALPLVDILYISEIHKNYTGDCYFPALCLEQWHLIESREYARFTTKTYHRKKLRHPSCCQQQT